MIRFSKDLCRRFRPAAFAVFIAGCATSPALADQFGDFTYTDTGSTITITGYPTAATGSVVVPDTIVGKPVTALSGAFNNCLSLTSVTLPSTVTSIGASSFANCVSLTSVNIPSGVTTIGNLAFKNCPALTSVSLPSGLTTIGTDAFNLCTTLSGVILPSTVTSIGPGAFYRCTGLTSMVIPSGVTVLSNSVFYSCSGLLSVTLPPNLITIQANAFQYCSNLTSITIPSTVTSIGNQAFFSCRGISSITIPASVTSIGTGVFAYCSSLNTIAVAPGSSSFKIVNGALTNFAETTLLAFPPAVGGNYVVPSTITAIATKAFFTCDLVTHVTFPLGLTSLGAQAFSTCTSLHAVQFSGDEPATGFAPFELTALDFTVYYLDYGGSQGFSVPTWTIYNYPSVAIPVNGPEVSAWLVSNGFSIYTDIRSDPNDDGVSLLMAYGLNLNPHENLALALPKAVLSGDVASLTFYSAAPEVTYAVEWSSDLKNWTTEGVTMSAPDANQMRTGTVTMSGTSFYVRLAITR